MSALLRLSVCRSTHRVTGTVAACCASRLRSSPLRQPTSLAGTCAAPTFCTSSVSRADSSKLIDVFVKRAGNPSSAIVRAQAGGSIAALAKLARATLLIRGRRVDLVLRKINEDGSLGAPLDDAMTLVEAAIASRDEVVVEIVPREPAVTDLPILPETHNISSVVAAIRSGQVTKTAESHLLLPDGIRWPAATSNLLFVRYLYAALFEGVLNQCRPLEPGQQDEEMRHVLTGQPGIGKSVMAWYLIYRVLSEQPERTVVFASAAEETAYIIPPSGPVRVLKGCLSDLDGMSGIGEDTVVVADSMVPPVMPFPTVVVSSSALFGDRDLNNKLNSYDLPHLYMPIPTEHEMLALHRAAFSHLDLAGVKRRLQLWGPIPRHVLVDVSPNAQRELWRAAEAVTIEAMLDLARMSYSRKRGSPFDESDDAVYRVIHERCEGQGQDATPGSAAADPRRAEHYERGIASVASLSMLRWILERAIAEKKEGKVASLLTDSVDRGPLGGNAPPTPMAW